MRFLAGLFFHSSKNIAFPVSLVAGLALLITGCGSSGPSGGPVAGGITTVAIQLSSTANDQLTQFTMGIQSISLTNRAGGATTIFSTPTNVDFIPANGGAYPLATVQVPQDIYTSAAVTFSNPSFLYTFLDSTGTINIDNGVYTANFYAPSPAVVTLAGPISVQGTAMGLTLTLDVSKSLTMSNPTQYSASRNTGTPTFNLTAFPVTAQSTTPLNGKCIGLAGQVASINAASGSITVTLAGDGSINQVSSTYVNLGVAPGGTFTASLNSATQYQGVASATGLAAGTFVNLDLALEPDASYTATRIEVQDATTTNVTAGQIMQSAPSYNDLGTFQTQMQGIQLAQDTIGNFGYDVYASTTKFQASARFSNLSSLPFTPVFSGANLAAGQMTSIGAMSYPTMGGTWALPTTITLMPQTIDAVVTGVSTSGTYTVYTVQLAPYDLIVQMNGPVVGTTNLLLPHANVVTVYVNSSTSLLNTAQLAAGGTFRFNGLLFNDAGALRMVADQVNDGVPQ
jgi:hypothetical protein